MKDFTLPRRDLEIKLSKCGLLAEILSPLRSSPLQASFSPRSGHIVEIGSHVGSQFHPPPQTFGVVIVT